MTEGPSTIEPFPAPQIRYDDTMDHSHQPKQPEEPSTPAAGIWTAMQHLRNGNREEAQQDSLRQFRWNLSFVRAAAGDAPPNAFPDAND